MGGMSIVASIQCNCTACQVIQYSTTVSQQMQYSYVDNWVINTETWANTVELVES